MKKLLPFLATFLILSIASFAQNSIQLNIHHKLADADFAMNTGAKNNLDQDFNVIRMEYYISEITIVHDGGTETTIEDLWVLANASTTTEVDLGSHSITAVEGLNFYIGVDPDHNHLDPTSYGNDHPLAPKNPSMHWGWASGYRFVAMEGKAGSSFNQTFELHGLGDGNYFKTEIALSATADNNAIAINIDADYTRALEDISVEGGLIVHAIDGEAKHMVENFRDYVFSPSSTVSSTTDFNELSKFKLSPNPTNSGITSLTISATKDLSYDVLVSDILGKQVQYLDNINSNTTIDLNLGHSGLYIVSLIKDGQAVISKKLMVK